MSSPQVTLVAAGVSVAGRISREKEYIKADREVSHLVTSGKCDEAVGRDVACEGHFGRARRWPG